MIGGAVYTANSRPEIVDDATAEYLIKIGNAIAVDSVQKPEPVEAPAKKKPVKKKSSAAGITSASLLDQASQIPTPKKHRYRQPKRSS